MTDCALPEQAANIFSLVRDPSQEILDEWQSDPPILIPDFTTGFKGASDAEIRCYARSRLEDLTSRHASSLSTRWIAVLDDKSPTEDTVVIHSNMRKSSWVELLEEREEEVFIPGQAEVNEADDSIWWKWRIPFKSGFNIWNNIQSLGWEALELYSRDEYLGEDGIVQAHIPDQIVDGKLPDPKGLF